MLCAAVRKAAVLQMTIENVLATIVKKGLAIDESIGWSKTYVIYAIIAAIDGTQL